MSRCTSGSTSGSRIPCRRLNRQSILWWSRIHPSSWVCTAASCTVLKVGPHSRRQAPQQAASTSCQTPLQKHIDSDCTKPCLRSRSLDPTCSLRLQGANQTPPGFHRWPSGWSWTCRATVARYPATDLFGAPSDRFPAWTCSRGRCSEQQRSNEFVVRRLPIGSLPMFHLSPQASNKQRFSLPEVIRRDWPNLPRTSGAQGLVLTTAARS